VNAAFALGALVAVAATVLMITRRNAVHALLYFVVSLLASAVIMFVLGAAFVAALEVIVYAGAIMVLFVFVIMLIGPEGVAVGGRAWIGPVALSLVLLAELVWVIARGPFAATPAVEVGPRKVGIALFGPYILGTEVAAFLLLAGLVGAFHLGRREATAPRQPGEAPQAPGGRK
jgi:NADH-quinone oxidoreductase subunit J